jgi:hypothetical protein
MFGSENTIIEDGLKSDARPGDYAYIWHGERFGWYQITEVNHDRAERRIHVEGFKRFFAEKNVLKTAYDEAGREKSRRSRLCVLRFAA